jgi:hypothetical protein
LLFKDYGYLWLVRIKKRWTDRSDGASSVLMPGEMNSPPPHGVAAVSHVESTQAASEFPRLRFSFRLLLFARKFSGKQPALNPGMHFKN